MYFSATLLENLEIQPNPIHIGFVQYTHIHMDKELHLIEIITSLLTLKVPLQQWYFGPIKQPDAEKLLLQDGNSTGTYLIRESDSQPDNSSLSVQDGNRVHHYLIKKTDTGKECKLLGFVSRHSIFSKHLGTRLHAVMVNSLVYILIKICPWAMNLSVSSKGEVDLFSRIFKRLQYVAKASRHTVPFMFRLLTFVHS